ncbi:MAG: hypothetical protein COV08_01170 [Candidatus Vogelbacteria bacterium CG10_big_fil_rev_8_21_14_0_10_49_38]|uniref:Lnb N-terminal periplasmic domain-containing protein n=1 Tax=Candidatus Vogelbacteria bacterium CG10_big_fil_rev_8_21_14_0_10_49_38 TaxID=1975043 RepID=A0A2H0RHX0_9BACT|nr:MAG: hypothetical protein BK006_01190 [bacterium CG10_49_38]PIR46151.1 MAG: hypothetical protein COV08_01170 [Candidatus Vogelbacteria bacterium CG10_big_fil_rev_8_21_14_0_10_49_38]
MKWSECLLWPLRRPANDRPWSLDQAVLPWGEIEGSSIKLRQIRFAKYRSVTDYTVERYDQTFNLAEIKQVSLVVEPFSGYRGPAHTFLTFEFADDKFVSISVEIRKQVGQKFSPWRGLCRQYELMYVIADERDVIKLRSNFRRDPVRLYPLTLSTAEQAKLFCLLVERANRLKDQPEFYHTIWHNCVTEFAGLINLVRPRSLPRWHWLYLFPANLGELFWRRGLVDQSQPLAFWQKHGLINARAEAAADDPSFSRRIRTD